MSRPCSSLYVNIIHTNYFIHSYYLTTSCESYTWEESHRTCRINILLGLITVVWKMKKRAPVQTLASSHTSAHLANRCVMWVWLMDCLSYRNCQTQAPNSGVTKAVSEVVRQAEKHFGSSSVRLWHSAWDCGKCFVHCECYKGEKKTGLNSSEIEPNPDGELIVQWTCAINLKMFYQTTSTKSNI